MDFGIMFANIAMFADGPGAVAMASAAENAGFESIWTVEHVVIPEGYESTYPYDRSGRMPGDGMVDMPDPLVWLAYVAAHTTTLKLGTGILIAPQRNPAILAKEVASLDKLSQGRVLLGVGAGWLEEEFDALGVSFADRGRRLDDTIVAMRSLWAERSAGHESEFTSFANAVSLPKPVTGSVPIIIGGHSKPAARRAGRLGDGFFPGRGRPDELRGLIEVMGQAAQDAGRDPSRIEITAGNDAIFGSDPLGAVEELASIGVSRIVIPPPTYSPADLGDALGEFSQTVIAKA